MQQSVHINPTNRHTKARDRKRRVTATSSDLKSTTNRNAFNATTKQLLMHADDPCEKINEIIHVATAKFGTSSIIVKHLFEVKRGLNEIPINLREHYLKRCFRRRNADTSVKATINAHGPKKPPLKKPANFYKSVLDRIRAGDTDLGDLSDS